MIPELNLTALRDPGRRAWRELAEQLFEVYSTTGFAYVTGHGVAQAHSIAIFQMSRAFHALPLDKKMEIVRDENHRGYIPMEASTDRVSELGAATKPNRSESFMAMRHDLPPHEGEYLSGPNQWPDLFGFRRCVQMYAAAMGELGAGLTGLFEQALGAEQGALTQHFDPATTWLRMLHYPSSEPDAPEDEFGSAPHTDFGFITLLAQDAVGGLQVQSADGDWLDVPYKPGAFVLNTGEMARRWSNGRLLATPHRVINRTGRERYSVPFFYDPHMNTQIAPLACCGEPQFEPLLFADYVRAQIEGSYDDQQPET